MNHEIKIETTLTVTTDDIVCLLSCQSGGFDYWCQIEFDGDDYDTAKANLKKENADATICYEDVLAEILEEGKTLYVNDFEDERFHDLTMEKLLKGFELNAKNYPDDASMEDGDADTADRILQYAIFDDVIYA